MYQPQIGDRIKFTGYTLEAYKNGSVPTFMDGEGIIIELENKLYLKLDTEYIIPIYYLDNLKVIHDKCDGCDAWIENTGTPAHCAVEKCLKESDITIVKKPLGQKISKDYWKDTIKELESEESFFGNQQFQEDTRMETCKYYSDYNQCVMGHYDEDRHVFCSVCMICDDYTKFTKEDEQYLQLAGKAPIQSLLNEYKKRPIRRT